jgi:hypothetical protein
MNAPRESTLWSLSATYHVATDATPDALLNDALALLPAAIATLELATLALSDRGSQLSANPPDAADVLAGTQTQLELARGMIEAALGRMAAPA